MNRYDTIRKIEKQIVKLLFMVSRHWDFKKRTHTGHAFCDGWIWASGPWLCYCCHKVRYRLEGRPWVESPRMWFAVATHRGHYIWPGKRLK